MMGWIIFGMFAVAWVALGFWTAKCQRCGFYRDPEFPGCNCPADHDEQEST